MSTLRSAATEDWAHPCVHVSIQILRPHVATSLLYRNGGRRCSVAALPRWVKVAYGRAVSGHFYGTTIGGGRVVGTMRGGDLRACRKLREFTAPRSPSCPAGAPGFFERSGRRAFHQSGRVRGARADGDPIVPQSGGNSLRRTPRPGQQTSLRAGFGRARRKTRRCRKGHVHLGRQRKQ